MAPPAKGGKAAKGKGKATASGGSGANDPSADDPLAQDASMSQILNKYMLQQNKIIKIADIHGPIIRCRQAPTKELVGVQDLYKAMLNEGGPNTTLHPLLVMETDVKGKYCVVDGDTRLFIYKTWFSDVVLETPCIVVKSDIPKEVIVNIQNKANIQTQATRRDSLADEIVRLQQAQTLFRTQRQAVTYVQQNNIIRRQGKTQLSAGYLEAMYAVTKMPPAAMDIIFHDCKVNGVESPFTWVVLMQRTLVKWYPNPELEGDVLRVIDFILTGKGLDGNKDTVSKVTSTTVGDFCTILDNRRSMCTSLTMRKANANKQLFSQERFDRALTSIGMGVFDLPWKNSGGASCTPWQELLVIVFPTAEDAAAGLITDEATLGHVLEVAEKSSDEVRRQLAAEQDTSGFDVPDDSYEQIDGGGAAYPAGVVTRQGIKRTADHADTAAPDAPDIDADATGGASASAPAAPGCALNTVSEPATKRAAAGEGVLSAEAAVDVGDGVDRFLVRRSPRTGVTEEPDNPSVAASSLQPIRDIISDFVGSGPNHQGVLFLMDPPGNILKPPGSGTQGILPRDRWGVDQIEALASTVTDACTPLNDYIKTVVVIWTPWQLMVQYSTAMEAHGWKTQPPIYAVNTDPHTSVRRSGQAPSTRTYMVFTRNASGFHNDADRLARELPDFASTKYHDHFRVSFALGTERCVKETSSSKELLRPEQKPVAEMARFISQFCPPDGVVIDLFAGTGSTGIAALQLGRRVLLMDADVTCVLTIKRRIQAFLRDRGLDASGAARGV